MQSHQNNSIKHFDVVNWTFTIFVLFGFNWKLVVEITERLYTAPTTMEIWFLLTAIAINTIFSFIKVMFVDRHYNTIYSILFTCCVCSLGLSDERRWDFLLFFVNILMQLNRFRTDIKHTDMPKLYYLLGAFGISVVLAFTSILPKNIVDFIPNACFVLLCAMFYCFYRAVQAIRHDRNYDNSNGTASVIYLVVHIISLTVPTLLIFFFLEDRFGLVQYTNHVLFWTQVSLVLLAVNFFCGRKKSDEKFQIMKQSEVPSNGIQQPMLGHGSSFTPAFFNKV